MATRNIKFQYVVPVVQRREKDEWVYQRKLDIYQWIKNLRERYQDKEIIDMGDLKVQIEQIKYYKESDMWVFRFLKLREDNIPSIAKANAESEGIPLGEDEYIGEDLYMLYDVQTGIAMVQVNRFSLSMKRLSEVLTRVWNVEGQRISLKPIDDKFSIKSKRRSYRSLDISFANILPGLEGEHNSLGSIRDSFRRYGGIAGHITINLGRVRNNTLNIDKVEETISEALNDESVVGLKVKVKDDDDRPVETIDLFDNVAHTIISFNIETKKVLNFEHAAQKMRECYLLRRSGLNALITKRK